MTKRAIKDDVRLEIRTRILPLIQDGRRSSHVDRNLFYLESHREGRENWKKFEVNEILTSKRLDSKTADIAIVAGRVGSGRTTLGRDLMHSWLIRDDQFMPGISDFEVCLLIDGEELEDIEYYLSQRWLPDTIAHWGLEASWTWIETAQVLLIVDNFRPDEEELGQLGQLVTRWRGLKGVLLMQHETDPEYLANLAAVKPFMYCQFQTISADDNFKIQNIFSSCFSEMSHDLTKQITSHQDDIPVLFETLGSIKYLFEALHEGVIPCSHPTVTDIVWDLTYARIGEVMQRHPTIKHKIDDWLMLLCQRCYECLASGVPFKGDEVTPLKLAITNWFPELPDAAALIRVIFSSQISLKENEDLYWCIRHEHQQAVLAAYYVLHRCMEGMPMERLLKKIECEDPFAIFAAGLLKKLLTEEDKFFTVFESDPQKREKKIERVLKNLGVQTDRSNDPIGFILRVLHEMKCHATLTKAFLQDSYIPRHLHIRDYAIYKDAIQAVIDHSQPSKIHLLIKKGTNPPQLNDTLYYLKSLKLELALALMNHLDWRSNIRSNDIFLNILAHPGCSLRLFDFIGCLDERIISNLHQWEATKYLVCLRVRVCDKGSAKSLVSCQDKLPLLMWLEVDFDFPIAEVLALSLPPIRTPLIDLSFSHIGDADIEKLCDFLHSVSRRFSGIHIHESSISPDGVKAILKYFYKRSMFMNADPKSILAYRRYRFPELSTVDPREDLNDDKVKRLLGYDDRQHYSDNEVHSSHVSTAEEVNLLNLFYGVMPELHYFQYNCSNYRVTKELDGTCVTTSEGF